MFDHIRLIVQAGSGGNGCESLFRRTDKKVVPHGGDGGDGGGVIFRADCNAPPLKDLRYRQHVIAESGTHGGSNRKRGKNGSDLVIPVPCGTRIFDRDRNFLIRDLVRPGDEVVVAKGGKGGSGNAGGKQATAGEKGKPFEVELRILLVADVFIVGLPNSGKSKILKSLTRSRAKEEDYPFATIEPEMGVHQISEYEQITLCELPALYDLSHEGRGRGVDFLTHLQRARYILYVLDPVSKFSMTLKDGFEILCKQLERFDEQFLQIPFAIVVNKMDLAEAKTKVQSQKFRPKAPIFYLSAATGEGLNGLKDFLQKEVLERVLSK